MAVSHVVWNLCQSNHEQMKQRNKKKLFYWATSDFISRLYTGTLCTVYSESSRVAYGLEASKYYAGAQVESNYGHRFYENFTGTIC